LMLPCSECELHLVSIADPTEGYSLIPRKPDAVTVEVDKWSSRNAQLDSSVDIADLDKRIVTLDRKIATLGISN
jgi:hypothetical protein